MFVSTKQKRIATLARNNPAMAFTSLNHHMDYQWLYQAYQLTRKGGATGVDGQTAEMYERQLESNLLNLLDRIKSGRYRAPAVKRSYIDKGNGQKRPLGIPTFEDKIVQRAVVMLLEPIYEQDFYDCAFGFRKQRSAHEALRSLRENIMRGKCSLTRFADDSVMVFNNREDCCRVEEVLSKRFERYGLKLHPEKTKRVDFRPYCRKENKRRGIPVSFDFLGFTHFWGTSRKGNTVVYQKTAKGRVARTLKSFNDYCRKFRHKSVNEQYAALNRKLRGHYWYHGQRQILRHDSTQGEGNLAQMALSVFAEELYNVGEIQPVPEPFPLGTA